MAFESVRSYVQLASGLGEMTKAKAMDAAQGLLALPGADEVTRRAVQASTLADQLLEAARANRANLLTLIQGEVESALKKADVARVADVDAARAALTAVTKEIADLRTMLVATGASAVTGASRSPLGRAVGGSGAVTTVHRAPAAEPTAAAAAPVAKPAATRAGVKRATPAKKAASVKKATARKTTARKATTKKAAPAKTAARKATAAKAAPTRKTPAVKKSTPVKKATTARKTSVTNGAPAAKKTTAKKATAKKATAKKTTAKKTTAKKTTAKKASP